MHRHRSRPVNVLKWRVRRSQTARDRPGEEARKSGHSGLGGVLISQAAHWEAPGIVNRTWLPPMLWSMLHLSNVGIYFRGDRTSWAGVWTRKC